MTSCSILALAAICMCSVANAQEAALPPQPPDAVVIPDCRMKDYFPENSRALLAIAESTGDLRRMMEAMRRQRDALDARLEGDTASRKRLGPVLDRAFSDETLSNRAKCEFIGGMRGDLLTLLQNWSRDPGMQRIHARIMSGSMASEESTRQSAARIALLHRLAGAMHLDELLAAREEEAHYLEASLEEARDRMSGARAVYANECPCIGPGDDAIVAKWLAPALANEDDVTLQRYLAFVESEAGYRYFPAYGIAHSTQLNHWHTTLASDMLAALPTESVRATENVDVDAMVDEAKRLADDGGAAEMGRARGLLQQAAALRPADAKIQLELGRIALSLRDGPQPQIGELRVPTAASNFAEAETHLKKAIELDETLSVAYLLYGHARFLQGDDVGAEQNYRLVRAHPCDCPRLDLYEGDLHAARSEWDAALVSYRAAFEGPTSSDFTRQDAYTKMIGIATMKKDASAAVALGMDYMKQHPADVGVGEPLVSHLIHVDKDDARALAIIEAAGEDRGDAWARLYAVALSRSAQKQADAKGRLSGAAEAQMRKAVDLIGGPDLLIQHCEAGSDVGVLRSVVTHSNDPKATATYGLGCLISMGDRIGVQAMIDLGADIQEPMQFPRPEMPLCEAYYFRKPEVFEVLLAAGANLERHCSNGSDLRDELRPGHCKGPECDRMLRMLPSGASTDTAP